MSIIDGLDGHVIWETAFSIIGAGLMFFAKEAREVINNKADKRDLDKVDEKIEDHIDDTGTRLKQLTEKLDRFEERQDEKHAQNTERLDDIYRALVNHNGDK